MSTSSRPVLEVVEHGDSTVVKFVDPMIMKEEIITAIGAQLFSLVEEQGRRKIILNFANVEYLASFVLGKFLSLNRKLKAAGGQLILCNLHPDVYKVFEISRLDKYFEIQEGDGSAAASKPSDKPPVS